MNTSRAVQASMQGAPHEPVAGVDGGGFVCVLAFREPRLLLRRKPRGEGRKRDRLLRRAESKAPKPPKPPKFILVFNHKRGWEFPGGEIREGEVPEEAAAREFLEETGYEVAIVERLPSGRGQFFLGRLGKRRGMPQDPDVKEIRFLRELPREGLAFPREEYEQLLAIARARGL